MRVASLLGLLVAAALGLVSGWGSPTLWGPVALAGAVALSEVAVVHLQIGRQRWAFSLTEAVLAAALALSHGAWISVAVAVGVAVAQLVLARPPVKRDYNISQFAVSAAAAVLVTRLAGGGIAGAAAGVAVFCLLNFLLVAAVVAATSQTRLSSLVAGSAVRSLAQKAGNSSVGLLAAYLTVHAPVGLLALVVPLGLLWSSYDQQARRSGEARLFAELARGQEQASGRSSDTSAGVVVTAAARLFGGADVEMLLLAAEGPVRYLGDEHGIHSRVRVDEDAFGEPWVLRAFAAGGVSTGEWDGRPCCTAVLGGPAEVAAAGDRPPRDAAVTVLAAGSAAAGPAISVADPDVAPAPVGSRPAGPASSRPAALAVLIARRPAGAAQFGRSEVRLAQVLVGQAESWLSVADLSDRHRVASEQVAAAGGAARALGDLGAATAPSLSVLRESAARLARLAAIGEVDSIVSELQLVERAVASLLGAVALAAEPDLLLGPDPAGRPELDEMARDMADSAIPNPHWTTTGLLR